MKHFYFRLIPPRPTFLSDISPAEAKLMQEHSAYWRALLARNVPIVFGPVLAPDGPFGVCVFQAEGEPEAQAFVLADPTIKGNAGFRYELYPMASAVHRE
jgi:uncharacterized protein